MITKLIIDCSARWEQIVSKQVPWLFNVDNFDWIQDFLDLQSEVFKDDFRRVNVVKRLKHKSGKL